MNKNYQLPPLIPRSIGIVCLFLGLLYLSIGLVDLLASGLLYDDTGALSFLRDTVFWSPIPTLGFYTGYFGPLLLGILLLVLGLLLIKDSNRKSK